MLDAAVDAGTSRSVGEATLLDLTHLRTHEAPSLMLLGCGRNGEIDQTGQDGLMRRPCDQPAGKSPVALEGCHRERRGDGAAGLAGAGWAWCAGRQCRYFACPSMAVSGVIDPVQGPAQFVVRVLEVGTAPVRGLARLGSDSLLAALLALLGGAEAEETADALSGACGAFPPAGPRGRSPVCARRCIG